MRVCLLQPRCEALVSGIMASMASGLRVGAAAVLALVVGCSPSGEPTGPASTPVPVESPSSTPTPVKVPPSTPSSSPKPSGGIVSTAYGAAFDPAVCQASSERWRGNRRFYLNGDPSQRGCFTSPWFAGKHPVLLSYGRTVAPWYASHVHHGVDIDMAEGTSVRSAVAGTVHVRPPTMGGSYGSKRLLVRADGRDYVLGHLRELAVADGDRVQPGDVLGRSGMNGCEHQDGPHLHFEVRPSGEGYTSAVDPWPALRAARA